MPTYRVISATGQVLDPAVQADSQFSALSGHPDDATAREISPNPPSVVYTVGRLEQTGQGPVVVEVMTTGSRATALREMGTPGRSLIEESPEANRAAARSRRS